MQTITANLLDHTELDKLVQEHLGLVDFECTARMEWRDDCSYYLFEDIRDEPNKDGTDRFVRQLREVENFINNEEGRLPPSMLGLLQYLCFRGHIKPGNYLIRVSW